MEPLTEYQMVLVEWLDSRQPTRGWQFLEDMKMPKSCRCLSVGWLLDEDADRVVIAAHRNDQDQDDQVMGIMVIPSGSIKKMTPLKTS
jgi:hypothetical protein